MDSGEMVVRGRGGEGSACGAFFVPGWAGFGFVHPADVRFSIAVALLYFIERERVFRKIPGINFVGKQSLRHFPEIAKILWA